MIHPFGRVAAVAVALFTCGGALAQFPSDPATPKVLAGTTGDQVQPKFARLADGTFYMSWYDSSTGYDAFVQRFDANGNAMWAGGPVRAIDASFSSTEDYGLTVDAAGNAVVVTRRSSPALGIVAQAISPEGAVLWGANGVLLSTTTSVNSPKAGRAGDGAAVAGWTEGNRAKVLRLNANGSPAWPSASTLVDGTATTILADLQPGDGDSVIASAVRYTTFSGAKTLQAQKYAGNGTALWAATNVRVFTAGSLQFGNFPRFLPDGEGGAIFAWYTTGPLMARVQWVSPSGALRFGADGMATTTDTFHQATSPAMAYDPATRRVYVSWPSQVPNSSLYGFNAQAFNESGTMLWGPGGAVIQADETVYSITGATAAVVGGAPVFGWTRSTSFNQGTLLAQQVSPDGNPVWNQNLQVTAPGSQGRIECVTMGNAPSTWGLCFFEAGSSGADVNIAAQRINVDGTLGTPAACGDVNGDGRTDGFDLGLVLGAWGSSDPAYDLNDDGTVNGFDLGLLLGCWTP